MVRIFVYGTLKRGESRSHVLRDQQFLGEARTTAAYRMYDTGSYPALVESGDGAHVEGEVWDVDEACLRVLDAIEAVPDLYQRRPVALTDPRMDGVETYLYQQSTHGMTDCGIRWAPGRNRRQAESRMEVVHLADQADAAFDRDRPAVAIVCAGDSITGWNNFGPVNFWPYPTYPRFLQQLCEPSGLRVADGGIAGEVSDNGPGHVQRYLDLFPNSRYYIIGFGTNDLGTWPDLESTSRRIIDNLDAMVRAVRDRGKQPILFNVPYANESMFSPHFARDTHQRRDYHNGRLKDYCRRSEVPLVDICSHLQDDHLGDELHPNQVGAIIIAERVFEILASIHAGR